MNKIKIVHLITGLDTGGAETTLTKLVLNMNKDRFDNIVMSMAPADTMLGRLLKKNGIPVISLGVRPLRKAPFGLLKLFKSIIKEKPDIIQTWLYHADFAGLLVSKFTRKTPVLWNIRGADLDPKDHPRSLFWLVSLLAKLSGKPDAIIINSIHGKKYHESLGYHPASWQVIPNGFDTDKFKPSLEARKILRASLGLNERTMIIGLVARYHPMKDHNTFLRAARELLKKRNDVHFVLVGAGVDNSNSKISQQIQDEGLDGYVSLMGERENIPEITAGFDLATCSSYSEGFPNSVGEAMACGVPCVVTDAGDARAIVGDTGVTVPLRDPVAMASAWRRLFDEGGDALGKRGAAARARIARYYSIANVVKNYEDLYTRLFTEGQLSN